MMATRASVVVLLAVVLRAHFAAGGRGGDRVPAEVRPCFKTRDGADVEVFRCLGGSEGGVRPMLDPFLVFDAYRATGRASLGNGFPAHAHRGFTELRYILAGALKHKDSCGNEAVTQPGGVQLFFAGKGAAHEENVTAASDLTNTDSGPNAGRFEFEGFQVWINAPSQRKHEPPKHRVLQHEAFPIHTTPDVKSHMAPPTYSPPPAALTKVLAGTFGGHEGTLSADLPGLLFLDVRTLRAGARRPLEVEIADEQAHVLIYVYRGSVLVESPRDPDAGAIIDEGEFSALTPGLLVTLRAGETATGSVADASCVLLTAPRVKEPVFVGSGFAMESRAALDAAARDLAEGRAASCG